MRVGDIIKCKKSWQDLFTGIGVSEKVKYSIIDVDHSMFTIVGDDRAKIAFFVHEFTTYFEPTGETIFDLDLDFAIKCVCGSDKLGHPGHDWYCEKDKGIAMSGRTG